MRSTTAKQTSTDQCLLSTLTSSRASGCHCTQPPPMASIQLCTDSVPGSSDFSAFQHTSSLRPLILWTRRALASSFTCSQCCSCAFHVVSSNDMQAVLPLKLCLYRAVSLSALLSCLFVAAGNFGIVAGFVCSIPVLIAFLLMLCCTNEAVAVNLSGNKLVQGSIEWHHESHHESHTITTHHESRYTKLQAQDTSGNQL